LPWCQFHLVIDRVRNGKPPQLASFFRSQLGGEGLRARAMRGSALTFIQFGGENFLRLASNLILTRLLFPEAFGLMALVSVVQVGLAMFSDLGISTAIIQDKRGDDRSFLNTAWTMQIIRGAILWLITCALAIPVAGFYGEPLLAQILPVAGMSALVYGFHSTRMETLNRHLKLGRLTAMNITAQTVALIIMSLLAWYMQSVWALVIGGLLGAVLTVVLSHTFLPGMPNRFELERDAFWRLLRFGQFIFFGTIASFLISQADKAILGKFVSMAELGIYNIGYFLASVPILLGNAISNRVLYPLYAQRPPAESQENRKKIARARLMVTAALLVGAALLAFGGEWLVALLYDERYHDAGTLLVLITLALIPDIVIMSYFPIFLASGHSGRFAIILSVRAAMQTALMFWAVPVFGMGGVPLSLFIQVLLIYPLLVWMLRPYSGWDPRHDAIFGLVGAIIIGLVVWINPDLISLYSNTG
jgi:O-antigen/teichoic acid export membrane protein